MGFGLSEFVLDVGPLLLPFFDFFFEFSVLVSELIEFGSDSVDVCIFLVGFDLVLFEGGSESLNFHESVSQLDFLSGYCLLSFDDLLSGKFEFVVLPDDSGLFILNLLSEVVDLDSG